MSQTKVKSGLLNFPDQTDFVKLPSGTTSQRPSSPEKGYSRYNTTDNKLEYWNGTIWQQLPGIVAPTIQSVSYPGDDLAADPAGGQTITLTGTNFLNGASIEIDGTTASVVTVVSGTEITFTAPAKTAGDYDIVLTNGDNTTATYVDGITYNGLPSWTTPAGNLGTFPAGSTIPTITLVATEPDSGVVSYSVTTGALPTGLSLTGADIDGTVPTPAGQTTYNFSVTASDDENQSTERAFNIVVYLQVTNTVDDHDPFDGNGIALYQLNGNANDVSGNYDGNFVNASYTTGVFGQAGVFDSSSKYMTAASPIGISAANANDDITVSAWIKFNSVITSGYAPLFGQVSVSNNSPFHVYFYGQSDGLAISFERAFDNKTHYADGYNTQMKYPFVSGVWYNVVVTYVGSTKVAKAYVNSSQVPNPLTLIQRSTTANVTQSANMGADSSVSINASIDQVRIFNTALTPLEVESLYRERTVVCGGQADTLDILGDNSCIATYQLNGNANDLSGNYSGTPTNVSYGVGEFDLAGVFNGTSSYINAGDPTSGMTTANYSVSFWVNTTSTSNSYLISKYLTDGLDSTDIFRVMNLSDGTIRFRTSTTNPSARDINSTSSVNNGVWNHVLFTVEPNISKLYINGTEEGSSTTGTANAPSTVSRNVTIGRHDGGDNYFNGSIDQVRIFNKALNSTEVTTLYNETACDALACSGTTNTLDILSDGSCIAAYPLDGSPADLSGNYNGVQTNVTYPQGKFDLGGAFNGSTSNISIGSPIANSNSDFSFSIWFKTSGFTGYQGLIGGVDTNRMIAFYLRNISGNSYTIEIERGFGTARYYSNNYATVNLPLNSWNHISLVYVASTISITTYLNNQFNETQDLEQSQTATINSNLAIGQYSNAAGKFVGEIDQVRIFNKALSAGEVTTLYNETACN